MGISYSCSVRPTDLWSRCNIVSPQTCNISINGSASTDSPVSTNDPPNTDNTGGPGNSDATSTTATDHPGTSDGGKFII